MKSDDLFLDQASAARFSLCRRYRYDLWRRWDISKGYAMFIGLNPSTADKTADDPTIRRCIGFARSWGYGALCMTNLFAFRATDPRQNIMCYCNPSHTNQDERTSPL